jgi:type IV pilus assembly protein PilC
MVTPRHDGDHDQPATRLTDGDAIVVASVVADASGAELPLPDALRAAAIEAGPSRLGRALDQLAEELARGRPLQDLCEDPRQHVSHYAAGLIRASSAGGSLAEALAEWIETQRGLQQTWRAVTAALTYPAILLAIAVLIVLILDIVLVKPMLDMFEQFGMELPQITQMMTWLHHWGVYFALILCAIGLASAVLIRCVVGAAKRRRILQHFPLFGMLWYWTGITELARLLAILLRRGVPMDEALKLSADGVQDANIREICLRLAAGVADGIPLSKLMEATHRVPDSVVPLVRWGERSGRLEEAFSLIGELYESRAQLRADLLAGALPPVVFIFLAMMIPLFVVGLYAPMYAMLTGLM